MSFMQEGSNMQRQSAFDVIAGLEAARYSEMMAMVATEHEC